MALDKTSDMSENCAHPTDRHTHGIRPVAPCLYSAFMQLNAGG